MVDQKYTDSQRDGQSNVAEENRSESDDSDSASEPEEEVRGQSTKSEEYVPPSDEHYVVAVHRTDSIRLCDISHRPASESNSLLDTLLKVLKSRCPALKPILS